jgi:hypothetical protein
MDNSMTITVALLILLNAVCIAIDRLTLNNEKKGIYLWFLNFWIKIDSLKIPDLPNTSSKMALKTITFLVGEKVSSIRFMLSSVLLSFFITTFSISVGMFFTQGIRYTLHGTYFYMTTYPISIYSINYIFDLMTIMLAIFCLKQIINDNLIKSVIWSMLFIFLAFVLAFACYLTLYYSWYFNTSELSINDFSFAFETAKQAIEYALRSIFLIKNDWTVTQHTMWGFYACSTFIPLSIYWGILLFTILSKAVLIMLKKFLMRTLSVILESDPVDENQRYYFYPFTTLGVVLSLFGAIIAFINVI